MPFKVCSKCQEKNGVRALNCKKCGSVFIPRTKARIPNKRKRGIIKTKITNWNEQLSQGDIVKIVQGSGPYYMLDNGDKQYSGVYGVVRVKQKEHNGFWATHYKLKQNRGSLFVYMGHNCNSPVVPNLIRSKHKIVKLENIPERT
tara:strand:- start:261 stop:695 length:435 start_codon:yes stop_codon:yes gene_type:complete